MSNVVTNKNADSVLAGVILISLVASLGSSLYVPSLPTLARTFAVEPQQVQLTISYYLLGVALSQLLFGPISDRFGRRPVVLIGLAIFVLGSIVCAYAGDFPQFISGRIVQGIGASVTSSVTRIILRDRYSGDALSRASGYNGISLALGLSVAPLIGGALQTAINWRAGFIFMAAYAALLLALARYRLPETNMTPVSRISLREVVKNYRTVLSSGAFLASVLCASLANAGLNIFYSISTYLLQQRFGLSTIAYSGQMVFITVALLVGRFINSPLTRRLGWSGALNVGNLLMAIAGVMLVLAEGGTMRVIELMLPVSLFTIGTGLVYCNSVVSAMQPFSAIAGVAGAMYGFLQMAISAVANAAFVHWCKADGIALGACFIAFGLSGGLAFILNSRARMLIPM